jgi:hypothetical protein
MNKYFIFISLCALLNLSFKGNNKDINIIAGVGISIDSDTIYIGKTSIEQILKRFNLIDNYDLIYANVELINIKTGRWTCDVEVDKNIPYGNIIFAFSGDTKDSLVLGCIVISACDSLNGIINDSITLGQTNPPIDKYFPKKNKYDYISNERLEYDIRSYGISFKLEKVSNMKRLKAVYVYRIIE